MNEKGMMRIEMRRNLYGRGRFEHAKMGWISDAFCFVNLRARCCVVGFVLMHQAMLGFMKRRGIG
jgi:hypothetical protein